MTNIKGVLLELEAMIKKRDGRLVPLDERRIINAISKAYREVGVPVPGNLMSQIPLILTAAEGRTPKGEPVSVEAIQDSVEERLVALGDWSVARAYVRYRYKREIARESSKTMDSLMLEIVDSSNEDVLQENANKNPRELATQRDYIAGEFSRDICNRVLMPKSVVEANKSGLIHQHDVSCL